MTAIRGVFGAVDELGAAYRNDIEDVRAMLFHALGGTAGILEGFTMSAVTGAMEVDFTAGRALIEESGVDTTGDDRGYYVFATDVTTVPFDAASVADRCDAVVFAWPDPQYGSVGTEVSVAGPQIVVVPGVSGSTTPRTDAEIATAIGDGGWFRYADVVIDSTDTEINPANITLTYPNANDRVGQVQFQRKTADQSTTSTSPVDDTHLAGFTVKGGASYLILLCLIVSSPDSTTEDINTYLEGPSGDWASVVHGPWQGNPSSSGSVGDGDFAGYDLQASVNDQPQSFQTGAVLGNRAGILKQAIYMPASDGTLNHVFLSAGGATVNLHEGSFMRVERLA